MVAKPGRAKPDNRSARPGTHRRPSFFRTTTAGGKRVPPDATTGDATMYGSSAWRAGSFPDPDMKHPRPLGPATPPGSLARRTAGRHDLTIRDPQRDRAERRRQRHDSGRRAGPTPSPLI